MTHDRHGAKPPSTGPHGPAQAKAAPEGARPKPAHRRLVAIPCLNEEETIGAIVQEAGRHADAVLVIDDGSDDETARLAEAAGAEVIRNGTNRGKGYGVRRAFTYARTHGYDVLVLMDGDGQHDPAEIPRLMEPIDVTGRGHGVDVALGFRHGASTEMPPWRRVGKRVLDVATAVCGAGVVTDSQCGYRAFGRRAIEDMDGRLRGDRYSIESEQLVIARATGLSLCNVTVTCRYRGVRRNRANPVGHALGVLAQLVALALRQRPLFAPGLLALAAAVALYASMPTAPGRAAAVTLLACGTAALVVGTRRAQAPQRAAPAGWQRHRMRTRLHPRAAGRP